jgi:hypothetical protein
MGASTESEAQSEAATATITDPTVASVSSGTGETMKEKTVKLQPLTLKQLNFLKRRISRHKQLQSDPVLMKKLEAQIAEVSK